MKLFSKIILVISIFSFELNAIPKTLTFRVAKDSNGVLDKEFIKYLIDLFEADVFFETGTYAGFTTLNVAPFFKKVYTVELSKPIYEDTRRRLHNPNIKAYFGSSPDILQETVPNIDGKIIFWLDAHFCGGTTAGNGKPNPILAELEAIKKTGRTTAVILIDDARGFYHSDTSLAKIKKAIDAINPEYQFFVYGDVLMAFLPEEDIEVSSLIKAFTLGCLLDKDPNELDTLLAAEKIIACVQGKEKEALERLTFPESGFYSMWRGLLKLQDGLFDQAEQLFRSAANYNFKHWRLQWYLAQAACNKNNIAETKKLLDNVLSKKPDFEPARELLKN